MSYTVAVLGATGAVGKEMISVLEQREFPVKALRLLASPRSAGQVLDYRGQKHEVQAVSAEGFDGVDIALFSAGGSVSKTWASVAADKGAVVIDNTSAFRMHDQVPLVVPEVNGNTALERPLGIIANPNCSTIQMVVALAPLHALAPIKRIVVSTYQAAAGAGARALEELEAQTRDFAAGRPLTAEQFPHPLLFDCLPHIGDFLDDGSTVEERKMVDETRKIFEDGAIAVCATTVRVPLRIGHGESIAVEFKQPIDVQQARAALQDAPGVVVRDEPKQAQYPLAAEAAGQDPVYVGRLRRDPSVEHGLCLWVVADNLRKGAALNAVQIAEHLDRHKAV